MELYTHAVFEDIGFFSQTRFEDIGLPSLPSTPRVPNPELCNGQVSPSSSNGDIEQAVAKVTQAGGINHYKFWFKHVWIEGKDDGININLNGGLSNTEICNLDMNEWLKLSMDHCQAMSQQVDEAKKTNADLMLKIAELEKQIHRKEPAPTPVESKPVNGPDLEVQNLLNRTLLRMNDLEEQLKKQAAAPEPAKKVAVATPTPSRTSSNPGTDVDMGDDWDEDDDDDECDEEIVTPTGERVSCQNIHAQDSYLHRYGCSTKDRNPSYDADMVCPNHVYNYIYLYIYIYIYTPKLYVYIYIYIYTQIYCI